MRVLSRGRLASGLIAAPFPGFDLALVTGWLGGGLIHRLGIGVHDDANGDAPGLLKRERSPIAFKSGRDWAARG